MGTPGARSNPPSLRPAASPKSLFLAIPHRAPKQSFCFSLLALICPPADPVCKKEMKSSPLGGLVQEPGGLVLAKESGVVAGGFVQTPREAGGSWRRKAGARRGGNPISLSGGCASCAPSEWGPMEKK